MISATINDQQVDVEIIEAGGTSGTALEQAELDLIAAIDSRLREHDAFGQTYPRARLTRVDSNRMLQDTEEGRFYLRYHHDGGEAEFWGHVAETPAVDFERGIVAVDR
ncbi:MAG: hypothetical protein P8Y02_05730 [Deinococcales bacterium]|jgi:hypothetical protein